MPNVNIYEVDYTSIQDTTPVYTVLIPGKLKVANPLDAYGNKLFKSVQEFDDWQDQEVKKQSGNQQVAITWTPWGDSDRLIKEYLSRGLYVLVGCIASGEDNIKEKVKELYSTTAYADFWSHFEDRGKYDILFIAGSSLVAENILESNFTKETKSNTDNRMKVSEYMIKLAAIRGDCTALIDAPDYKATNIRQWYKNLQIATDTDKGIKTVNTITRANGKEEDMMKYGAGNDVYFTCDEFIDNDKNRLTMPPTLGYLACFGDNVSESAPWFAFAGQKRGALPYTNIILSKDFGDAEIAQVQLREAGDRCSNPICNVNPWGKLIWGNRTLHTIENKYLSASDFLNIRNLVNAIKKQLYKTARKYTFEPNDDVLWINFTNDILPLLNQMKSNRGIRGFSIKKVKTDKKATLKAVITISPIEAVEDFDLTIDLVDSVVEE